MADTLFTTHQFFGLHGAARWVAFGLLAVLLLFVGLHFLSARYPSRALPWFRAGSLRSTVGIGVILLGVIPAVALGLLLSERSAHSRQERMEARIEEMAESIAYSVERLVDKHKAGITAAASSVNASGDFSGPSVELALLRYHVIYRDFLTMLGTDRKGDIIASSSALQEEITIVERLAGLSVADRNYFKEPMQNGFPFVSQVFRGRGLGTDPIVAISASLRNSDGMRVGIIEGSLDLGVFETIEREHTHIDTASMIIVDDQDRVIFASADTDFALLESLENNELIQIASNVRPQTSFGLELSAARGTEEFMAAYATTTLGWRVFVRVSTKPIAQQMFADYKVGLVLLAITLIISLLMAAAVMRRVKSAVEALNHSVESFSLDETNEKIRMPRDAPSEFKPLFKLMQARSKQLQRTYTRLNNSIGAGEKLRKELTQAVALKEVEIARRTEELERANEKLSTQSRRDPLTKIANRREFENFETRVWKLGAREQIPVAVVLVDIDHFKAYNDTLGHQAGDDCLKQVAVALNECANRPLDLVARYGGEEFVAVLGGAAIADALVVADNMRNAVLDLKIRHPLAKGQLLTVSVGAASVVPSSSGDANSLVKAADEALYHAKEKGRDRVVFWRDGELVTHDSEEHDLDSTNIIKMLAGDRLRAAKGRRRN
jgi:diguanylate cyclase (GGDEF)-like protein